MRDIGLNVPVPRETCNDPNCPFHGELRVRGKIMVGTVVSDKMKGTVTVRKDYLYYLKKYMRYEKRRSKLLAHNPPCVDAREGDVVRIAECKPVSKHVSFVVIEKIKSKV